MREFFSSKKFKILLVVACLLIGLILRASFTGGLTTFTQNTVSTIFSPFQKAASYVTDGITGVIDNVVNMGTLKNENESLKKQVNDLQDKLVDYDQIKSLNDQLKDIAGMKDEEDNRKLLPAKVVSRDPGQWFSSFTIDKGKADNIELNQPVVTADGLVGVVTSVDKYSSVVSTILDNSVHVGIIISRTGDTGITEGQGENSEPGDFEIDYLTKNSNVTQGDIVITNGKGGVFPKNIKVGIVGKLHLDNSGNSVSAVCKPIVDPTTVKNVFVITDFTGKDVGTDLKSNNSSNSTAKGDKK